LPLYFPRSPQEELYAAQRLPLDVGNEDGEPVIAERKIRIAASPAVSKYNFYLLYVCYNNNNNNNRICIAQVCRMTSEALNHRLLKID